MRANETIVVMKFDDIADLILHWLKLCELASTDKLLFNTISKKRQAQLVDASGKEAVRWLEEIEAAVYENKDKEG